MFDNILDAALSKWLQHTPSDSDHIVISSRIRLARNFRDTLFTNKNDEASLHHVDSIARGLVTTLKNSTIKIITVLVLINYPIQSVLFLWKNI